MNRQKRVAAASSVLASALMLPSAAALAQGPGWTANGTVSKLAVTGDGGVNVLLSPPLTGCASNYGYGSAYASIYPNHPGLKQMKADLLTAYVTGRPVSLYLTDNTCRVGELILGGW